MQLDQETIERIKKRLEDDKANPDGTCKEDDCGGRVIKKLMSIFHGQRYYTTPECEKCGRIYVFEENATAVGHREFHYIAVNKIELKIT